VVAGEYDQVIVPVEANKLDTQLIWNDKWDHRNFQNIYIILHESFLLVIVLVLLS
jgi:hypothetical protein